MFVTFTISPLLFIFLICKSQFKLDGISWRRGKSQDLKLFLWFATREERGEKQERRNQNLQSLIFRFTVLQMMIHILVPAEALRYFGGKSCWKPFIFWSLCRRPFFVLLSLNFWSKVCCTSGHKSWAGGRTSCSIYSQHHNLLTVPTFAFLLPHIFRLSGLLKEKLGEEVSGEGRFQKVKSLWDILRGPPT